MAHRGNYIVLIFVICRLMSTVGLTMDYAEMLVELDSEGKLSLSPSVIEAASIDFGGFSRLEPMAVMHPINAQDISNLIQVAYSAPQRFPVSARGHGHSIDGQATALDGVVILMSHVHKGTDHNRPRQPQPTLEFSSTRNEYFVDVWGGELWIDVLNWTLANYGLAPKSWTDYLYLSVGGTLSNAGISGQTFHHGPQISNVYELDVVTGKGEMLTCSEDQNSDLFFGVLGGLGQFGIITRARIALEVAPQRVRWIRVLYSNFTEFTSDQEYLISLHGSQRFDYVEGFVIVDEGLINNWRSSFFSPKNPVKISSIGDNGGVLYCLEMTKNYDESSADTIDQEVETLLSMLDFIPASVFTTDLPYIDFLDRVHKAELKLRAKGLWEVPHPWLNLFVPRSRITDFDQGVFWGILGNKTSGPILIYPMNKHKWDERSSVVTPDEEIFYLVAFLRSALMDTSEPTQTLEYLSQQNEQILAYCHETGIDVKQYLPHHKSEEEWTKHFGAKWDTFLRRKDEFDPKYILGSGQGIFHSSSQFSSLLTS